MDYFDTFKEEASVFDDTLDFIGSEFDGLVLMQVTEAIINRENETTGKN